MVFYPCHIFFHDSPHSMATVVTVNLPVKHDGKLISYWRERVVPWSWLLEDPATVMILAKDLAVREARRHALADLLSEPTAATPPSE